MALRRKEHMQAPILILYGPKHYRQRTFKVLLQDGTRTIGAANTRLAPVQGQERRKKKQETHWGLLKLTK
jgi:hypothetical protein